jgi:hypothetical protein
MLELETLTGFRSYILYELTILCITTLTHQNAIKNDGFFIYGVLMV